MHKAGRTVLQLLVAHEFPGSSSLPAIRATSLLSSSGAWSALTCVVPSWIPQQCSPVRHFAFGGGKASFWKRQAFMVDSLRLPWRRGFGTVVPFPLAQTGEGIKECELLQWFVKEGDTIAEFDKVCEVQSDKATIEITSRYAGRVSQVMHEAGAVVKVGEVLVNIELEDTPPGDTGPAGAGGGGHAGAPASAATPASTSGTSSGADAGGGDQGSAISKTGAVLCSPAVRYDAREAGVDLARVQGSGPQGRVTREDLTRYLDMISRQTPAAVSSPPAGAPTSVLSMPQSAPAGHPVSATPTSPPGGPAPLSPAVSTSSHTAPPGPLSPTPAPQAPPAPYTPGVPTRLPLRGYRRAMIKTMSAATAIPHFHFCDEVHMDALMALRKTLQSDPLLQGVRLTNLPFLVKALSVALRQHPVLNCSLAPATASPVGGGEEVLLLHEDHNIGVAMATPSGLVVPNVKQVQSKSVVEVAHELAHLQARAAAGQLSSQDLSHGTITVSNIGSIGGTYATPLVAAPEVAIVALGRIQHLPRFDEQGNVVGRAIMCISWGADHRVVDGAALAAFSNCWKGLVQEPARLLLHCK